MGPDRIKAPPVPRVRSFPALAFDALTRSPRWPAARRPGAGDAFAHTTGLPSSRSSPRQAARKPGSRHRAMWLETPSGSILGRTMNRRTSLRRRGPGCPCRAIAVDPFGPSNARRRGKCRRSGRGARPTASRRTRRSARGHPPRSRGPLSLRESSALFEGSRWGFGGRIVGQTIPSAQGAGVRNRWDLWYDQ